MNSIQNGLSGKRTPTRRNKSVSIIFPLLNVFPFVKNIVSFHFTGIFSLLKKYELKRSCAALNIERKVFLALVR